MRQLLFCGTQFVCALINTSHDLSFFVGKGVNYRSVLKHVLQHAFGHNLCSPKCLYKQQRFRKNAIQQYASTTQTVIWIEEEQLDGSKKALPSDK